MRTNVIPNHLQNKLLNVGFKHITINETLIRSTFANPSDIPVDCFNFIQLDDFGIEDRIVFLLVLSSLNFCFWNNKDEDWYILHRGSKLKGLKAIIAILKSIRKENERFSKTIFSLSQDKFYSYIQNSRLLLFMPERYNFIKEIGHLLRDSFNSNPMNLLKTCNKSAKKLVTFLGDNLSAFKDAAFFRGNEVMLCKKAHFFAAVLHYTGPDIDECKFDDINELTVFPDYRLPQILRHFGILNYSTKLSELVDNKKGIPAGSEYEIEIRSATVVACEKILRFLHKKGININAVQLDQWLFRKAKDHEPFMKPHHRTLTTCY